MGTSENKLLFDLLKKKVIMLVSSFAKQFGEKKERPYLDLIRIWYNYTCMYLLSCICLCHLISLRETKWCSIVNILRVYVWSF